MKQRKMSGRVLAAALAGMTMAAMSACGAPQGGETRQQDAGGEKASAAPSEQSPPAAGNGEKVKITYLCTIDLAVQESYTTRKLPEALAEYGYDVELEMRPLGTHDGTEWGQKFQLMVASGDQPADVIQLGDVAQLKLAADAGWLAEVPIELIQKNMPRYYEQVNKIYDKMWAWGKDPVSGTQYGVPSFNMFGPTRHTLAYRGDWLEKFGMEPPETIEEFETWLRRCREQDPNGNGQADEYGYTSQDMTGYFSEVFGAFGVMPGQWMIKDGKVERADIQPEVKEALSVLRRWYEEDLIPKGILTTAKRDNDFYAGICGTMGQAGGYAPAIVPSGSFTAALVAQNPGATIVGAPSFKGPGGDYGTWEWGPRKYILCFGSHLDEERIGYLMGMFETIAANKDLFELTMLGERGVHWDFVDKASGKGATEFLEPYTDFSRKLNEVGVREMSESAWCPVWLEEVYGDYLDPLAVEYAGQNPGYFDPLLTLTMPSDPQYKENLDNFSKSSYLDIITGKADLDSFESYVAKWKQDGGDILTGEANDIYERLFK